MEKIFSKCNLGAIVLLFLVSFFTPEKIWASTEIFGDSFGAGSTLSPIPGWVQSAKKSDAKNPSANGNDSPSPQGERFALIEGGEWICKAIDSLDFKSLYLSYYWRGDGQAEEVDRGIVEYKIGSDCNEELGWEQLQNHNLKLDTTWTTQSEFALPVAINGADFLLRFRADSDRSDEDFRVDGILLIGKDEISPVLTVPQDIVVQADSLGGAFVDFQVSANDDVALESVVCNPLQGSYFVIGSTVVNCTATDASQNISTDSFDVTVSPGSAIFVTITANPGTTIEADLAGVEVDLDILITDNFGNVINGSLPFVLSSDKGNILGDTPAESGSGTRTLNYNNAGKVNLSFTGLSAQGDLIIDFVDTTKPIITFHENVTGQATSPLGARVEYSNPLAIDNVDGQIQTSCLPQSNSLFAIGQTTVICSATDASSNTQTLTFDVNVADATVTQIIEPQVSSGGGGGGGSSIIYKTGDTNFDSKIDKNDLFLMKEKWGQSGAFFQSDINRDNKINEYDFSLLMFYWTE